MTTTFKRAPADEAGIHLVPGTYFFDTSMDRFQSALPQLVKLFSQDAISEMVDSGGRGLVLLSVRVTKAITLPRSLGIGHAWILPPGMSLIQAHDALYSPEMRSSRGFWEWLQVEHPKIFELSQKTAHTIDETAKEVAKVGFEVSKTTLIIAGSVVLIALLGYLAVKSRRNSTREIEYNAELGAIRGPL